MTHDWAAYWSEAETDFNERVDTLNALELLRTVSATVSREIDADLRELDHLLGRLETNRCRLVRVAELSEEVLRYRAKLTG